MPKAKKMFEPASDNDKAADKDMLDLLVSLIDTPYWQAIQRYNRKRDSFVMQSLRSIDPFKDTTQLARIQGIGIGLYDLENGVMEEVNRRKKETDKSITDTTKVDGQKS